MRLVVVLLLLPFTVCGQDWLLPVDAEDRYNRYSIALTDIGRFGEYRKARRDVGAHLHAGVDIKRPGNNYTNNPIYAASKGKVVSVRNDGPFAQIIVEHDKVWTVYEHIAGIVVKVGDEVGPMQPIARFMNREELNQHGWQFDHVHFEIMKVAPIKVAPTDELPQRYYASPNLKCINREMLYRMYYPPLRFLDH